MVAAAAATAMASGASAEALPCDGDGLNNALEVVHSASQPVFAVCMAVSRG